MWPVYSGSSGDSCPSRRRLYRFCVRCEQTTSQSRASPGIGKTGDWQDQNCRSLEDLEQAISRVPLDMVQIHGAFDEALMPMISVPVIRAIQLSDQEAQVSSQADYLLFDAPVAGSGQTFDWGLLKDQKIQQDFFIAGGLTEDNVRQARETFQPYAVDVSSGVETDGRKDIEKIKAFIEGAKA